MILTSAQSKDFKDSQAYAATRLSRDAVRKIGRKRLLTKTQCAILLRVTNLWHTHTNGSGVIHPGCAKTAKIVGCDRRTVIRAFERLRELGIMIVQGLEKGGAGATRYIVDVIAMWKFSGAEIPEAVPGNLVEIHRHAENVTGDIPAQTRDKMSHDITDVRTSVLPQEIPDHGQVTCDEIPDEIPLEELEAYSKDEHERPIPKYPVYPKAQEWLARCFERFADRDTGEVSKVPHPRNGNSYLGRGLLHV